MPIAYIKIMSSAGKGTIAELEHKWKKAMDIAEEEGHEKNYAYITGIFNKMIGKKKAEFNSGILQEDVNYDITDRMGQSTQRSPDYRMTLAKSMSKLTPDMKGNKKPVESILSGTGISIPNFMSNESSGEKSSADPDPVARFSNLVTKDLMPEEYSREEKEAENIADTSLGSVDMNLVRKSNSAMECIWRIYNAKNKKV